MAPEQFLELREKKAKVKSFLDTARKVQKEQVQGACISSFLSALKCTNASFQDPPKKLAFIGIHFF